MSRGIEPLKKVLTVPRINHSAMTSEFIKINLLILNLLLYFILVYFTLLNMTYDLNILNIIIILILLLFKISTLL